MAVPRVGALRLSPEGDWLAATVQTLSPDAKKYLTSIWRIDPQGGPARRLTRSAEGEGSPRFLPDSSLLFTSKRPEPGADQARRQPGPDVSSLWLLPSAGGEARVAAGPPGGVAAAEVAAGSGTIVITSPVLPAAEGNSADGNSAPDDARRRQERNDAGITAILHESAPIRYWDHDLGPDQLRFFAVDPDQILQADTGWTGRNEKPATAAEPGKATEAGKAGAFAGLRDLTPEPGRALDGQAFELTPDGTSLVTGWWQWKPAGESHSELVLIDVATGKRRVLLSVPEFDFSSPRVSPDGRFIACARETHGTADRPTDITLVVLGVDGSAEPGDPGRDLVPGMDRWPQEPAWSHDSRSLYFAADDGGRRPVFRVEVETAEVTRVTGDDGAYTELNVAPDGRYLYALRATVASPPTPVRIDLTTGAEPAALDCPGVPVTVPGRLTEVE